MCKIVTFQDTLEARKAETLHLESSTIFKPFQATVAYVCGVILITQS